MSNVPTDTHPHLGLVLRYLRALEQNAADEQIAEFYAPDVKQREFPNRLLEQGAERDLEQLRESSRKGRLVVEEQRFAVENALVDGDRVALELTWTARLKVPLGKLQPGDTMTARCGVFFHIRDGRIAVQHNYDCFEPF
jgi:ketosteroid isomerase-like protein